MTTPAQFQQSLKDAGFDPVWIDGLWGDKSANACRNWFNSSRDIVMIGGSIEPIEPPPETATVVPPEWLSDCDMERVIIHWTAGSYDDSENDREHYHILVDGNCELSRGLRTIKDNVSTSDGIYAAHTANKNTGSIGISACCMAGAIENPFSAGKYPLQEAQWIMLARIAADLCRKYDIGVTPQTILQHGEVQANLDVEQSGKWDICKLPWQPSWTKTQVGNDFRNRVSQYLAM